MNANQKARVAPGLQTLIGILERLCKPYRCIVSIPDEDVTDPVYHKSLSERSQKSSLI